jgi:hypothetical protein
LATDFGISSEITPVIFLALSDRRRRLTNMIDREKTGMTPVLESSSRALVSAKFLTAARIVQKAAEALASESSEVAVISRYLLAADRISAVLDSPRPGRQRLLKASPALTERSGRSRTLIEMIEAEPDEDDDETRFRLAKLLFRALIWNPETFPDP